METRRTTFLSSALVASAASYTLAFPSAQAWAQDAAQEAGQAVAETSMEQRVGDLERRVREQQDEIAALKQSLSAANDSMLAMIQGRGLNERMPQVAPAWATEGSSGYALPSPTFGKAEKRAYSAPSTPAPGPGAIEANGLAAWGGQAPAAGVVDGSGLAMQTGQAHFWGTLEGNGLAMQDVPAPVTGGAPQLPQGPVGEGPAEDEAARVQARVQAVPQGQGVLTRPGRLVIEPALEGTLQTTNRLVFRGIELVPGLQIGVIEASRAERESFVTSGTARYGISPSLEAEVRVPFFYRHDRIQVVAQRDEGIVRTLNFHEKNFGDVEAGLRYQINRPSSPQDPVFVAGLRAKSNTGKGPFDIGYDIFGIATGLTTGSGFWAVSPSLSFLLPSDPVVIYGGTNYLWHIGRDINKVVGDTEIGHVDPGDAISANLGFGFALNPRFSFSLGYSHSYVFPTKSEIGGTMQRSDKLQVGSLQLGMAYRVDEQTSINFGFVFGVTEDAPDVGISLRVPITIDLDE